MASKNRQKTSRFKTVPKKHDSNSQFNNNLKGRVLKQKSCRLLSGSEAVSKLLNQSRKVIFLGS